MSPSASKHVLAYLTWSSPGLRHGIRAYAREANWNLSFPSQVQGAPRLSRHFDGIIILVDDSEVFDRQLVFPNAKIVDIRGAKELKSDALVLNDNEQIGRMAADYLYSLGIRRFTGIAFAPEKVSNERLRSFETRARELGGTVSRIYSDQGVYEFSYSPSRLMAQVRKTIRKSGLPLGVFGVEDFMADLFTQAAVELGYKVPQEVAVLGCNNDRGFCEDSRVPLSSIDVNLNQLGFEAARILDQLMHGNRRLPRITLIPPLTVEKRASTESHSCNDRVVSAILSYIKDHFSEKITAEHIIRDIHASRAAAYNRFSRIIGHPIGKEIERVRLENAKSLLLTTDYKLDVVARLSGYTNTPAFCRTFRKTLGVTPTDFRETAQVGSQ